MYTNMVRRGTMVNVSYNVGALGKLKVQSFQVKGARNGSQKTLSSTLRLYHCICEGVDGGEKLQDDRTPAMFIWPPPNQQ